jgi:hypothetical protein
MDRESREGIGAVRIWGTFDGKGQENYRNNGQ